MTYMIKKNLFLNKKVYSNYTPDELDLYIDRIYNYYRDVGFPYYIYSQEDKIKDYRRIEKYDTSNIIENSIIKQTMHGLGLLWSYFPHAFEINSNGKLSPMEAFTDNNIFRQVIKKRLKMGDNLSDAGIRKMLKIFTGVQGVSNFRPTSAKAIYDHFCPFGGVVYDMSSGFGGRLLGSILSPKVSTYIGVDPSDKTYKGLIEIKKDFGFNKNIEINRIGSEDFTPTQKVDLCFTSPPYYNTEHYSTERTQSYIKFESKKEWMEDFLGQTLRNCIVSLNKQGSIIVNIANVPSYPNLEDDFLSLSKKLNLKHVGTLKYSLSKLGKGKGFKYEPVFVFKL